MGVGRRPAWRDLGPFFGEAGFPGIRVLPRSGATPAYLMRAWIGVVAEVAFPSFAGRLGLARLLGSGLLLWGYFGEGSLDCFVDSLFDLLA